MDWPDIDPTEVYGNPAISQAPYNTGVSQMQGLRHIPHVRNYYDAVTTFTTGTYAAIDNSVIKQFDLNGQFLNCFVISPSAMNNGVGLSLQIEPRWVQLNGVFRPVMDYYCAPSQSSLVIRVPTRANYSVHLWINSTQTAGYQDAARLIAGYLPDWEMAP